MARRTGLTAEVATWINKNGPGYLFFADDVQADLGIDRSQTLRTILALSRSGWGIVGSGNTGWIWNGTVDKPKPEPAPAVEAEKHIPHLFEYVGHTKAETILVRDEIGMLYYARPVEDF